MAAGFDPHQLKSRQRYRKIYPKSDLGSAQEKLIAFLIFASGIFSSLIYRWFHLASQTANSPYCPVNSLTLSFLFQLIMHYIPRLDFCIKKYYFLYSSASFANAGIEFSICSVVTQYAIRTYPFVPKESAGTNNKSYFFAFSQKAFASSSSAFTNR